MIDFKLLPHITITSASFCSHFDIMHECITTKYDAAYSVHLMATSLSVNAHGNRKDGSNDCIDIISKPHQSKNITFPKVLLGKTKSSLQSFQVHWFQKWTWLHWHTENEHAYCHTCLTAFKNGKLSAGPGVQTQHLY
jgi:hypothetical protein